MPVVHVDTCGPDRRQLEEDACTWWASSRHAVHCCGGRVLLGKTCSTPRRGASSTHVMARHGVARLVLRNNGTPWRRRGHTSTKCVTDSDAPPFLTYDYFGPAARGIPSKRKSKCFRVLCVNPYQDPYPGTQDSYPANRNPSESCVWPAFVDQIKTRPRTASGRSRRLKKGPPHRSPGLPGPTQSLSSAAASDQEEPSHRSLTHASRRRAP